jgi:hypothetical protein
VTLIVYVVGWKVSVRVIVNGYNNPDSVTVGLIVRDVIERDAQAKFGDILFVRECPSASKVVGKL